MASPATKVTAETSSALARSTRRRRGSAAKVTRIMPVEYSDPIASTPSTTTAIWPTKTPFRL